MTRFPSGRFSGATTAAYTALYFILMSVIYPAQPAGLAQRAGSIGALRPVANLMANTL
jgi:hypothetical protein